MGKAYILRHPVESLRAAPYGAAIAAGGLLASSIGIAVEYVRDQAALYPVMAVPGAAALVYGSLVAAEQLRLQQKAQVVVAQHGFDPRFFSQTTDQWCNRQTVRVALQGTPHLEPYKQLCQDRRATALHARLPHF